MLDANDFMTGLDSRADVQAAFKERGHDLHLELMRARKRAGLTQEQVAERMRTNKTVVSRLESSKAKSLTSMNTIERCAAASGHRARLVFEPIVAD